MTDRNDPRNPRDEAMDRLIEQNRILQEARMLPHNRALRGDEIDAVRQRARYLIETSEGEHKVTGGMIAKQIGVSRSTFSAWLNGTYPGDVDKITRHVNDWTERHSRRQGKRSRESFIWTWAVEQMVAMIDLARNAESMIAIVAPSGSGKDMVIDYLADKMHGHVVNCHEKMTAKEFLIELADVVGLSSTRGTAAALIRQLVKHLADKSCMLFLNEAQQLPSRCASMIRTLHDQTSMPIAMLGSYRIFEFINDRTSGGGQFSRRCMRFDMLNHMAGQRDPDRSGKVGRKLFSRKEVAEFIETKKLRLANDDAFDMLYTMANLTHHGTLGLVNAILEGVIKLNPGERVTTAMIVEMLNLHLGADAAFVLAEIAAATDEPATPVAASA